MDLPPGYRLTEETRPAEDDLNVLHWGLDAYNRRFLGDTGYAPITLFVRDREGTVCAGLHGAVYARNLFVELLWVHAELRRRGIGRQLLAAAEARAKGLGCNSVWLDSYSFQAPDFYKKYGYIEFGRIAYPPDHCRIFLEKRLSEEAGDADPA
jgi:GNAT superfamily N-acetyltransferase